jgi:hypothetical protein
MYLAEVTSRGALEENWCLVKHLLHAEGHAEESMANAARAGRDDRVLHLSRVLNRIRKDRQEVVDHIFNDHCETPLSCERCRNDLSGFCPACEIAFS